MTQKLTEDDLYRTSTQFRLWSFAPETLASLRAATHNAAIERARSYLNQQHDVKWGTIDIEARCLSLEEEYRLVQRYCDQIRSTNDHFKWPINVKATAVQYLKRFYLTNSCLTYPPKEIYKSVLFLASKTEGTHMTLGEYARRISTAPEQILAPEYKIIQALRFTLDVRQPYRGLKGALMELLNLAEGQGVAQSRESVSAAELQEELLSLDPPSSSALSTWKPLSNPSNDKRRDSVVERCHIAYTAARSILDAPALLTDVFFLYTPPQIYFAALRLADPPLTDYFLSLHLPAASPSTAKIMAAITACMGMLAAYDAKAILSKDERAALEQKLEECRDPGSKDMVALNAKTKSGTGDGEDGDVEAQEKKKRKKLERAASMKEGEDLFGPSIGK